MFEPKFSVARDLVAMSRAVAALALVTLTSCTLDQSVEQSPDHHEADLFREVAADLGFNFVHRNGASGDLHMFEILGSGAALIDYDLDGDLDIFAVQGAGDAGIGRLFRNDLETGELGFSDVSSQAGLGQMDTEPDEYGIGVVRGDYDRDGWPDLFVTKLGRNRLLRNVRGLRFEDVATTAGVAGAEFSTAATFFDFDGDGWLDLFVGNYVDYRVEREVSCSDLVGARDYCGPGRFPFQADRLYRNGRDGTFDDVSEQAGLTSLEAPTLGVVAWDYDRDGALDLYVANDAQPNALWRNLGDGKFENVAMLTGSALNSDGQSEGSMGVEVGDVDNDGDFDVVVTHLMRETNTLYLNEGTGSAVGDRPLGALGFFADRSRMSGLGQPSLPFTGFGIASLDFDRDGLLDIFVANGSIARLPELERSGHSHPYSQPNLLLRNVGEGRFEDASDQLGSTVDRVSRGVAVGDLDNDGDSDLVVVNNADASEIQLRQGKPSADWIGLRLQTPGEGGVLLQAHGAQAALVRDDLTIRWRRTRSAGSYASAPDSRIILPLLGLGERVGVRVMWRDGVIEEWSDLPVGAYRTLVRGTGRQVSKPRQIVS